MDIMNPLMGGPNINRHGSNSNMDRKYNEFDKDYYDKSNKKKKKNKKNKQQNKIPPSPGLDKMGSHGNIDMKQGGP